MIWGDINKGQFKYYLGILDLDGNAGDAAFSSQSPLYSARLQYAIIGSEPGFYGSSTYYGSQDIVSIGAAFQYQKDFTVAGSDPDHVTEFNVDALAEFNTGSGTVSGEAAYYHADGDAMAWKDHFYVLASYLTPNDIGIGKLQPLVRYQQAKLNDADESTVSNLEFNLSYVIKDYFAKIALAYTHSDFDAAGKANMLQLGLQVQQ